MNYRKLAMVLAVIALVSIIFSCGGDAKFIFAGMGKASDPVPFMTNARTGVLPSGIRYYILENTYPEDRAYLTLAVNAGSVLETDEERGLAHFVEHMAFNGTARFGKSELIDYLRSLGMRYGPEVNAYTSFDETVYGIEVPVETGPGGRKIIPDRALAVIDDWSYGIKFDPEDVENEKLIILEEYRSRLGARERISREIYPVLFRGSPYAERLPIGIPQVIEKATAGQLEEFYKKWYQPENMAIIIVGDFDAAYLEGILAEHFPVHPGRTAGGDFKRPLYDLREPETGNFETLILTDSELTRSRIDLYWKLKPEVKRQDLSYCRESIINALAEMMLYLRFEEETEKSETPYVGAGAGMANYGYSSRYYMLVAQAKTGSTIASLRELFLAKESLLRHGFTRGEIKIAKASLLSYFEQLVEEKDNQPSEDYVNSFTRHFLEGETVSDFEWELKALQKFLPGITRREINRAIMDYFSDDDLTVIITAPEDEEYSLPTRDEIQTLAAEIRKTKIAAPVRGKGDEALLSKAPVPGKIVSEYTDSETRAIRIRLDNGVEVILKETKNKNSEVSFYAQARGGTFSFPLETDVSVSMAAEMLNVSGLGSWSRSELTRMLLDKQVSMAFWANSHIRGFQGSAAVKDIKTLFEMIYLGFTQPRLDPEAIKAMLDQRRSSMAYQENDPNTVFDREIYKTISTNPRSHSMELADLDKANIDEAYAFILACSNPGDYTFVFAGNIDLPVFRSMLETYLASIPASVPFNEWPDVDPQRPRMAEKEIFKGREERSTVYMCWFNLLPYSEEKSLAATALSEYLEIQLNDVIRETLGGVYSISSWVSHSIFPKAELRGGVYFVCDPKRSMELDAAVREEFNKIAKGNIETGVFEKAIEALIKGHEQSIQGNFYIAQSYANSVVIYNSPLSRLDKRPALYRSLNPQDIQRTAADLLGGSFIKLFLYPEV
ncbi:MAG: insulinase family protein [Treponema sp.]|nr:insulinase family protein [Treponema sp.]